MALTLVSEKEGTSYNRKTDTEYVYINSTYFDDELQRKVHKRKLIGKIDRETGERIPTGALGRPRIERPAYGNAENDAASSQPQAITGQGDCGAQIDPQNVQAVLQSMSTVTANIQDVLKSIGAVAAELSRMQKIMETIANDHTASE